MCVQCGHRDSSSWSSSSKKLKNACMCVLQTKTLPLLISMPLFIVCIVSIRLHTEKKEDTKTDSEYYYPYHVWLTFKIVTTNKTVHLSLKINKHTKKWIEISTKIFLEEQYLSYHVCMHACIHDECPKKGLVTDGPFCFAQRLSHWITLSQHKQSA